jgi:hypothetical protein
MIISCIKAFFGLLFASPVRLNQQSIGLVTGNGGFDLEDSNFNRKQ